MIELYSFNHQSIAERESAYHSLPFGHDHPGVRLQTCNRIEFYTGSGIVRREIAEHLFRVVSGLASSLVGEIAIQGQVRDSYRQASQKYKLSCGLHQLFQTALYVGKKVRNGSGISKGAMSHSQAAAEIISAARPDLEKAVITLIGVHKLNEDIIRFLLNKGAETIFLANKTFDKAEVLANKFGCHVMRFDLMNDILRSSDIIISATAAPHLIIRYEDFNVSHEILILDLAFPRDVDERIGSLAGVTLYNLEDIELIVRKNIDKRISEAGMAEKLVLIEVEAFLAKSQKHSMYAGR